MNTLKTYIGIVRDHSASMGPLAMKAAADYNQTIEAIKASAIDGNVDTIVSVIGCGVKEDNSWNSRLVKREVVNSSVLALKPITNYQTPGSGTPLFDSVGELIEIFEKLPDFNKPEVSFMIMVVTDGQENASQKWKYTLQDRMRGLQGTDRWSFVFRVPVGGYKRSLVRLGVPEGNIYEWETTNEGLETSTVATTRGFDNYYKGLVSGVRSTASFYADMKGVTKRKIERKLDDISNRVKIWDVKRESEIRDFIEFKMGSYKPGAAFYQLVKVEKVQPHKHVCIRDTRNDKVYTGPEARDLIGLPKQGEVRLRPGSSGVYDVFIQSTSVNRKLIPGQKVLYITH